MHVRRKGRVGEFVRLNSIGYVDFSSEVIIVLITVLVKYLDGTRVF